MPPIINFKICDNSADCNGISMCPMGVFSWDETARTIKIDTSKCVDCGACDSFCTINALRYAKDATELARFQKEIDDDPRTVSELFVERYGATPLDDTNIFEPSEQKVKNRIKSGRPVIVEFNQEKTIECLLKSVLVADIMETFHKDATFSKFYIEEKDFKRLGITSTPCLRFYYNNELLGQIDEYFTIENQRPFMEKIAEFGRKVK